MSAHSILLISFATMALWATGRKFSLSSSVDFLLFLFLIVASGLQMAWALFGVLPWYFYLNLTQNTSESSATLQNSKLPDSVLWSALLVTALTLFLQTSKQSDPANVHVFFMSAAMYIAWDLTITLRRPSVTWRQLAGYRLISFLVAGLVTLLWVSLSSETTLSSWMLTHDPQTWWSTSPSMNLGNTFQLFIAGALTLLIHLPWIKSLFIPLMRLLKIAATFGILLPKLARNLAMVALLVLYLTSLVSLFPSLNPYRLPILALLVWLLFAVTLHSFPMIRQLRLALLLGLVVSVVAFMDNNMPAWLVVIGVSFYTNIFFYFLERQRPESVSWNVDNANRIWGSLPRLWQTAVLLIPLLILSSPLYFIAQIPAHPGYFLQGASILIFSMQMITFVYLMHLWTARAKPL